MLLARYARGGRYASSWVRPGLTDTAPSTDGLFDTRFFEAVQAEATPK